MLLVVPEMLVTVKVDPFFPMTVPAWKQVDGAERPLPMMLCWMAAGPSLNYALTYS